MSSEGIRGRYHPRWSKEEKVAFLASYEAALAATKGGKGIMTAHRKAMAAMPKDLQHSPRERRQVRQHIRDLRRRVGKITPKAKPYKPWVAAPNPAPVPSPIATTRDLAQLSLDLAQAISPALENPPPPLDLAQAILPVIKRFIRPRADLSEQIRKLRAQKNRNHTNGSGPLE